MKIQKNYVKLFSPDSAPGFTVLSESVSYQRERYLMKCWNNSTDRAKRSERQASFYLPRQGECGASAKPWKECRGRWEKRWLRFWFCKRHTFYLWPGHIYRWSKSIETLVHFCNLCFSLIYSEVICSLYKQSSTDKSDKNLLKLYKIVPAFLKKIRRICFAGREVLSKGRSKIYPQYLS